MDTTPQAPIFKSHQMVREWNRQPVENTKALARVFKEHLGDIEDREIFMICALNSQLEAIATETAFIGSVDCCQVHVGLIFRHLLAYPSVDRFAIAHNHPSGDPSPSAADIKITQDIATAGRLMSIDLVDHMIIAKDGVYSFTRQKQLEANW